MRLGVVVDVSVGVSRCPTQSIRHPLRPLFMDLRQADRDIWKAMRCLLDVRDYLRACNPNLPGGGEYWRMSMLGF